MRFVDAKSSKVRQGRRIHQVGFFLQRLIKNALDGRVPNQFGLPLRNVATVTQRYFFNRAFGNLRQECSRSASTM